MLQRDSRIPEKGKGSKLTAKMQNFVDEYFVDFNGSAAVKRAGYKSTNPNKLAGKLLNHPLVMEAVAEKKKERQEKTELSAEYVIQKLISIAERNEEGNPTAALRSLELLGKHLGLYKDRQEISGPDGEAIQMEQKVKQNVDEFTSRIASLAKRNGTGSVVEFPDRRGEG
jgi:phage terminase small subunit